MAGKASTRAFSRPALPAPPTAMAEAEGESSGAEADAAAKVHARAPCGQFVWPCPRAYPAELGERQRQKWLKPADMSKAAAGNLFKDVCTKLGHGPNLAKLHVFDEPHKRYSKATGERERHKHIVFKMALPFAHLKVQKELALHGVRGHFSFSLVGYAAYLSYCLSPSAKKLAADIDADPWSWPAVPASTLLALVAQPPPQLVVRGGGHESRGRKRSLLTFSEITDAFVEGGVVTVQGAWALAKSRKVAGDDTLWNTLGKERSVSALVDKVYEAWHCGESTDTGALISRPDYGLGAFVPVGTVSDQLVAWVKGGWKEQALILSGASGFGKTEFGCALMHAVSPAKRFHFLNRLDRVRDTTIRTGEGVLIDEICLANRDVDDVKALVDLKKRRDITCRNRDGTIPNGTPRLFTTNWDWEHFWPREAFFPEHLKPIKRRTLWIDVKTDLKRAAPGAASVAEAPSAERECGNDEEEGVFGFGCSLDG